MSKEQQLEIEKAYHNGSIIQFYERRTKEWISIISPCFYWKLHKYRIKPE